MSRLGRGVVVLVVGAVVAGGGIAAYARDADAGLRTATVTRGEVQQTLELTGTLSREGRADLVFPTAGTVAALPVALGDKVDAGDVVARLETRELRDEVRRARSRLASARAQLEADLEAQTSSVATAVSGGSSSGTASGSAGAAATASPGGTSPEADPSGEPTGQPSAGPTDDPAPDSGDGDVQAVLDVLAAQQQAVLDAQSSATTAIEAAKAALSDQQAVCAAALEPGEGTGDDTRDDTGDDTGDVPTEDPTDAAGDGSAALEACTAALGVVRDAQDEVAVQQDVLQASLEALGATLTDVLGSVEQGSSSDPTPTDPAPTDGPSSDETGSQQSGQQTGQQTRAAASGTGTSTEADARAATLTVTAATLAADQASIEEARATLVQAQDALAMATVRAPISGTLVATDVAQGDSVAAGGSVGVVVSEGSTVLTATVALADVPSLEPGQQATVVVAGGEEELEAEVTQIGTVPDDTGAYPVTLELRRTDLDLPTDLPATASVVVGEASDALVVPASAVSDGAVSVVDAAGFTSTTRVTTGLVGATTVAVLDGLEEGQEVVLAELGEPLPGADDTQVGPGAGSGGGFGGGGPPAGFAGGGPGGGFPGAGG